MGDGKRLAAPEGGGPPPGRRDRRRGHRVVLLLVALVLVAVAVGYGTGRWPGTDEEASRDPWRSAGVARPEITQRTEAGQVIVTVRVQTSLPLPDDRNRTGFARRAAKIVWRSQPGPVDVLELGAGEQDQTPLSPAQTWHRAELERTFGPRPDGLDAGNRLDRRDVVGDGPYRHREVAQVEQARAVLQELLVRTAREHFPGARTEASSRAQQECMTGFLGHTPTGTYRGHSDVKLTLAVGGEGEAQLPGLATYWSGLGVEVDISGLDNGLADLDATVDGVGGFWVHAYSPAQGTDAVRTILFSGTTDCHQP